MIPLLINHTKVRVLGQQMLVVAIDNATLLDE